MEDVKGATFIFHPHDTLMVGPLAVSSTLYLEFRSDDVVKSIPQMGK